MKQGAVSVRCSFKNPDFIVRPHIRGLDLPWQVFGKAGLCMNTLSRKVCLAPSLHRIFLNIQFFMGGPIIKQRRKKLASPSSLDLPSISNLKVGCSRQYG